jgi:hypothetical protein
MQQCPTCTTTNTLTSTQLNLHLLVIEAGLLFIMFLLIDRRRGGDAGPSVRRLVDRFVELLVRIILAG